jgi:3-phosphoshikimate 1-carboxyvinyltransferase
MNTAVFEVGTAHSYKVTIGHGLLDQVGSLIKDLFTPTTAVIVSDTNVAPLYADRLKQSLEACGWQTLVSVFPAGEASKRLSVLEGLLNDWAHAGLHRDGVVFALGGGVTGDLAGFGAAIYQRGIPFVQIPTTLLAAVDSSVGGKTAVDIESGKNLAGCFWQPSAVICDVDTIATMQPLYFADGVAESIKTAVLAAPDLLDRLTRQAVRPDSPDLDRIAETCIRYKNRIVSLDERDKGQRGLLNLGHTIGHAIEHESGFSITHGHGVAAGLAMMSRACERLGLTQAGTTDKICAALEANDLPTDTDLDPQALLAAARRDKKASASGITIVVPEAIGACSLQKISFDQLGKIIALGKKNGALKILPHPLTGTVRAIPSKSAAHRAFIAAALADAPSTWVLSATSKDIEATLACLQALGAHITRRGELVDIIPISKPAETAVLDCGESGSTLRFLLPVAAALGCRATFTGRGRLPDRPITDYLTVLKTLGLECDSLHLPLTLTGRMHGGRVALAGNVSSQYITGLLLAAGRLEEGLFIRLTTELESRPYVDLTRSVLSIFDLPVQVLADGFAVQAGSRLKAPSGINRVEGDWSNAAFFLAAGALASPVTVTGLDPASSQGDRAILDCLKGFGAQVDQDGDRVTVSPAPLRAQTISVRETPDLFPILAVLAACAEGESVFTGGERLRLKESDRIATVSAMLEALGVDNTQTPDGLRVTGCPQGFAPTGPVSSANDHRIAMAAAIAALRAPAGMTLLGPDAAAKSYPGFYDDFRTLGGQIID